jgi:hypothetical protein
MSNNIDYFVILLFCYMQLFQNLFKFFFVKMQNGWEKNANLTSNEKFKSFMFA